MRKDKMKNLTRREFLKVFAPFAALAAFVLPRPKIDEVLPEAQQDDKTLLTGIERANTRLIDNANFDVEIGETTNFLDALKDTVTTIEAQADAFEQFERAFDHAFFTSWDLEGDPDEMERYKAVLDSCECAPMEWHVEYKQCESPEWEYVKCPDCGSDNWVWNDGFRCLDCGAEGVDPCIEKGVR